MINFDLKGLVHLGPSVSYECSGFPGAGTGTPADGNTTTGDGNAVFVSLIKETVGSRHWLRSEVAQRADKTHMFLPKSLAPRAALNLPGRVVEANGLAYADNDFIRWMHCFEHLDNATVNGNKFAIDFYCNKLRELRTTLLSHDGVMACHEFVFSQMHRAGWLSGPDLFQIIKAAERLTDELPLSKRSAAVFYVMGSRLGVEKGRPGDLVFFEADGLPAHVGVLVTEDRVISLRHHVTEDPLGCLWKGGGVPRELRACDYDNITFTPIDKVIANLKSYL